MSFLAFSLISTLIAGQMAGRYGGNSSPSWVIRRCLLRRSSGCGLGGVLLTAYAAGCLTVVGAALTQVFVAGFIYSGVMKDLHAPDWSLYLLELTIVLGVIGVDAGCCGAGVPERRANSERRSLQFRWKDRPRLSRSSASLARGVSMVPPEVL